LEIVSAECMGISDDRDIARVDVESIVDIALAANRPDAEGIFLSCTALRALDAIPIIEARLGKPVISSNQASLWRLLQLSGLAPSRVACGRLFEKLAEGATA
ncbi:MAG: ectoine utilization protein EutA, partial [Planctomycetota bacterium]